MWHTQNFSQGRELSRGDSYHAGTLEYDASDYLLTRAFVDRPACGATGLVEAPPRSFNKLYEQEGGVPRYDRGTDAPLSAAASITKLVRTRASARALTTPFRGLERSNLRQSFS